MRSQKERKKDTNNEVEYEEFSVTDEVPRYFNIFECGRNILNKLDVTYEQACLATQEDEYYTDMLETIIDHKDRHKVPL